VENIGPIDVSIGGRPPLATPNICFKSLSTFERSGTSSARIRNYRWNKRRRVWSKIQVRLIRWEAAR